MNVNTIRLSDLSSGKQYQPRSYEEDSLGSILWKDFQERLVEAKELFCKAMLILDQRVAAGEADSNGSFDLQEA